MSDSKPWYKSMVFWGVVVAYLAPVLGTYIHHEIDTATQSEIAQALGDIAGGIGVLVAVWGRVYVSTKTLTLRAPE